MLRQDRTYKLDLADLDPKLRGRESLITYRTGGRARAWLKVENPSGKFAPMLLTWVDQDGQPINRRFTVHMTATAQPYGGSREWFSCPTCFDNARVLYWKRGGFRCQACAGLLYMSQLERPHDYALIRAQRIRTRLGGSANMCEPFPPKPPRMHWRTYYDLQNRHNRESEYYIACMMAWVLSFRTRYKVNGRKVADSDANATLAALSPVQDDTGRDWGKVSDYVTAHVAGDNRPTHKADRPACAMPTKSGIACRARAKPGFTICHRHLECAKLIPFGKGKRVKQYESN